MKLQLKTGVTSRRLAIFIADASSTTGAGLTGLTNGSAGLVWYYWREDQGNVGATSVTLAAGTRGTFASGGFVEKDSANMPGFYEIGVPDAALASGAKWVTMMLKGATNMVPLPIECQLVAYDPDDAVALGLSRIDAAVSSRMATFTLPTNFSSLSIDASGRVDLGKWIGTAPAAISTNGYVSAMVLRWKTDDAGGTPNALISGRVDANAQVVGDKTGYSLTQAFPTNFSALAITAGGAVTVGTNSDKTGYSLTTLESAVLHSGTAQAGAASTITLAAGASATDSIYNGEVVKIYGATGAGQSRVITGYVGSTKVATVDRAWQTNPDNTSTYAVLATDCPKTDSSLQVVAASVQGNVTGSVASVTGAVGSVTAGVTVTTNNDKTGYSLSQTFPTNFSTLSIDGSGRVDLAKWVGVAPNALQTGRVDSYLGATAVGVIDGPALAATACEKVSDALLGRNIIGGSNTGRLVKEAVQRLRNRVYIAAGVMHVTAADDTADSWTATVTTTAGSPISDVDPA